MDHRGPHRPHHLSFAASRFYETVAWTYQYIYHHAKFKLKLKTSSFALCLTNETLNLRAAWCCLEKWFRLDYNPSSRSKPFFNLDHLLFLAWVNLLRLLFARWGFSYPLAATIWCHRRYAFAISSIRGVSWSIRNRGSHGFTSWMLAQWSLDWS